MQAGALRPYERSLLTAESVGLYTPDGTIIDLDVERWLAPADWADNTVLTRCQDAVLDIGCGPGRFVAALLELGVNALGVDIAATAIALARQRGLPTVHRSVFAQLPAEGQWSTVLLTDGNIGIGGDPARLLARARNLLKPSGICLIELHPDQRANDRMTVRFCREGRPVGPAFNWAQVGLDALREDAEDLGFVVAETWSANRRSFATLIR